MLPERLLLRKSDRMSARDGISARFSGRVYIFGDPYPSYPAVFVVLRARDFFRPCSAGEKKEFRRLYVRLHADNLASLLKQAQSQAGSGALHNGQVSIGGFGVKVESCKTPPCSVIHFADFNTNFSYDEGAEEIQTVSFGRNVTINSVSAGDPTHVIFKPPQPFVCIESVCSGTGIITITLGSTRSSKTVEVVVNQLSGQITAN